MSINYIDDNGVRQIFSDIKTNIDTVNNTAVSAYNKANEAYVLASEGAITPNNQVFNIEGSKTFNIDNNGNFYIISNRNLNPTIIQYSNFYLNPDRTYLGTYWNNTSAIYDNKYCSFETTSTGAVYISSYAYKYPGTNYAKITLSPTVIQFEVYNGPMIQLTSYGIYMSDGKGKSGYINISKCI